MRICHQTKSNQTTPHNTLSPQFTACLPYFHWPLDQSCVLFVILVVPFKNALSSPFPVRCRIASPSPALLSLAEEGSRASCASFKAHALLLSFNDASL